MSEVCKHCGKGSRHWTEWDLPGGDRNGNGACKDPSIHGGCVGEWSCRVEAREAHERTENKKYSNYGGRLGYITSIYPKVHCPICQTPQVQITDYMSGDPEYKCRHCKQVFTLPFKEPEKVKIDIGHLTNDQLDEVTSVLSKFNTAVESERGEK
ncbi:hypothetical protein ACPV5U_08745 [Vibrio mediterranei]